ncbi:MAG: PASTA domain-containing protein [Coriobacteriales bacterium]|nr:PASTA domain-containing protein [Coriobacteriales bacterium]
MSVPDVMGDTEATARKKIEDRGLVFEVSTRDDTPANEGKVIEVSPTPGTAVKPGSTVKIVIGTVPTPPTPGP